MTFVRCLDDGVLSRITGYFHSPSQIVSEGQPLEVGEIVKHFNEQVENFTKRGSGYVLEEIVRLTLSVVKYRPMRGGSSYIETPPWLRAKRCCVNVKNPSDDFCFKYLHCIQPKTTRTDFRTTYHIKIDSILPIYRFRWSPVKFRYLNSKTDILLSTCSPTTRRRKASSSYILAAKRIASM